MGQPRHLDRRRGGGDGRVTDGQEERVGGADLGGGLFVEPGDGLLDRVLHAVRDGGGDLRHVSLQAPSLEDVYVHLTGKGLRE